MLLDESGLAKKLGMQLETLEFCDEMSKQLLQHATSLDGFYKQLHKAVRADPPKSDSWFQDTFDKLDAKFQWFAKVKAWGEVEAHFSF